MNLTIFAMSIFSDVSEFLNFSSTIFSALLRLETVIRIGIPMRSASLNFTPGLSSRIKQLILHLEAFHKV